MNYVRMISFGYLISMCLSLILTFSFIDWLYSALGTYVDTHWVYIYNKTYTVNYSHLNLVIELFQGQYGTVGKA